MTMSYELFIGLRYLKAKRKQTFISIITLISITGVAIGVMALILVLGVMTGFSDDLREKILGTNSHLVIQKFGGALNDYRAVMEKIRDCPGVVASTPFILSQAMLSSGTNVSGVVLRGIDIATAPSVIKIKETLVEGSLDQLGKEQQSADGAKLPGILVGKELAKLLGVGLGEPITVISPTGLITPTGMAPRWKKFLVVAIFESGMYEYDTTLAYISMANAQSFLKMADEATGVEVKVTDIYQVRAVADAIREKIGLSYLVRDWMEMHRNLYSALKLEKTAMFIILVLIILVAAFNIIGTLIMVVHDKNRDIAILKAMGATSSAVMRIFMIQGLVIGVVGTTLGLFGGYLLAFIQNQYHVVGLSQDIYYIPQLTVKTSLLDTFWISFAAVLITFLATIYPSRQAARLDPAEGLRYE
jgi:lipoprotein-releasing system permease protein